jgi:hypothetical protein
MFCNRIFDFVTQTKVVLAAPSCQNTCAAGREQPIWDFTRPNLAATDLIRRHEKILLELGTDKAA